MAIWKRRALPKEKKTIDFEVWALPSKQAIGLEIVPKLRDPYQIDGFPTREDCWAQFLR